MRKILYVSLIDWFWIKQRPQQIVERLSDDNKVDYFCIRSWQADSNAIIKHNDNDDISSEILQINPNLKVYRQRVLPKRDLPIFSYINYSIIERFRISRLLRDNSYDTIILTYPYQIRYFTSEQLGKYRFIYDCMDDYANFSTVTNKKVIHDEERLVKIAGQIVVSSSSLKEKIIDRYGVPSKKIKVVNNGVDTSNFSTSTKQINQKKSGIIGYVGAIDTWFDFDALYYAANSNFNLTFNIYGPVKVAIDKNEVPLNVFFKGPVQFKDLGNIVEEFDVGIMPFRITNLIKSVNPVKIYEYLAVGLKVVAIRYGETEKFSKYIKLYNNKQEFASYLKKMSIEEYTHQEIEIKKEFAAANNWDKRSDEFTQVIDELGEN